MPVLNPLQKPLLEQALSANRAVWAEYDDLRYVRFVDDYKGIPRGTAVFDDKAIFGYPSIGRVLSLQFGLQSLFAAPFWIEEKVDGFNVRVFLLNNRIFALTRGGFICPFTTDRIDDLLDTRVFNQEPVIVLCAEVAGPDNPYMEGGVPYIKEDVEIFVFDVGFINQTGFAAYREKEAIIDNYQLPPARRFGLFQAADVPRIRDILLQLNDERREGVIFKEDSPRDYRTKYTTSNINLVDIEAGAFTMFDLPPEYFRNRLTRLVLFMDEMGIADTSELRQQLGAAYLEGLFQCVQQVHQHHKVFRTFRCRFRQRENAVKLLDRLSEIGNHVQIILRDLKQQEGYWLLEYDKVFAKTSGSLSSLLKGSLLFD
jgi:putative ATP-dependent DNA ligase